MDIFAVITRTLFFYFFIALSYRIMGKREMGQLGIFDLIVSILIAELVAISIEKIDDPIYLTIIPILILVSLEVIIASINLRFRFIRNLFNGKPATIITNGNINYKEMVKQRYNLDDLLLHLRQKDIRNLEEVEYAILEPNGNLSVFKHNLFKLKSSYPLPVIIDGQIQKKSLQHLKKSEAWLIDSIKTKGLNANDIFYAFYKGKKFYIVRHVDLNR